MSANFFFKKIMLENIPSPTNRKKRGSWSFHAKWNTNNQKPSSTTTNQPHLEDENAAMRLAFKISNP